MRTSELTLLGYRIPASMLIMMKAAFIVAGATIIVKFAAFIKEAIVARFFGLSSEMDAFVIAYGVVTFLVGIISSSIQASLIPWLFGFDEQDLLAKQRELNNAFTLTVFAAAIFAIALFLSAELLIPLVGYALSVEPRHLAVLLVKIFSLNLLFVVINGFFYALLQKEKRFFLTGLGPVFTPISVILYIVLFSADYGIYTLAFGAVVGAIAETLVLLVLLARLESIPRFAIPSISADLRRLFSQTWVMMIGAALMGSTLLVDRAMASTLGEGAVSALAYGSRLPSLIDSLGATAIATAVLPYFSEMISRKDWAACRQHLKVYAWVLFLVAIPIVLVLSYMSSDIVRLIFQHGAFTPGDTMLVSEVQQMYLLAVPPFIVGMVAVRMLSALTMNHFLTFITIIIVGLNASLNLILMKYYGVAGIALSTAFVYVCSTLLCLYFSFRRLNRNAIELINGV